MLDDLDFYGDGRAGEGGKGGEGAFCAVEFYLLGAVWAGGSGEVVREDCRRIGRDFEGAYEDFRVLVHADAFGVEEFGVDVRVFVGFR